MLEPTAAQDLFKGRHFDHEIIILCVRWYLTFKLSSRDLVQMMAERASSWSTPRSCGGYSGTCLKFEKRWRQYARPVGDSWRVDETYLKIKGEWVTCTGRSIDRAAPSISS